MLAFFRPKPELWPALVCAGVLGLGMSLGAWRGAESVALDTLFRLRGPRDADPRVVVIAIDDAAVVRAGERTGSGWPLPRRYYTRAIRQLQKQGAKTIALDVLLSEPGPSPAEDADLARQCRAAGNIEGSDEGDIVTASQFRFGDRFTEIASNTEAGALPPRFAVPVSAASIPSSPAATAAANTASTAVVVQATWAAAPFPKLSDAAAGLGHVNVFPEASGALRRLPPVVGWRGQMFPSLSLAAATHFLEKPATFSPPDGLKLGNLAIPLDEDGLTAVNWIGGRDSHPTFGLNQLLDGEVSDEAIRDRLILIGVTAPGAYESRATPFASDAPAIEFQANAVDDLVSSRVLQPVSPWLSSALAVFFTLACGHAAGLASRSTSRSSSGSASGSASRAGKFWRLPLMLLGLMLALLGGGVWCLSQNLILPIGAALGGGAAAFFFTAAAGYRRELDAGGRADAAFASLSQGTALLRAALSTAETDPQHLLALIRSTARETLGAREVFLLLPPDLSQPLREAVGPDSAVNAVDSCAAFAARRAQKTGTSWVWPPLSASRTSVSTPVSASQSPSHFTRAAATNNPSEAESVDAKSAEAESADAESDAEIEAQSDENSLAKFRYWLPRGETLVAAPLPQTASLAKTAATRPKIPSKPGLRAFSRTADVPAASEPPSASEPETSREAERETPRFSGALVAVGRLGGGRFSARDARLLETLAESAALALENWHYSAQLRGRVESANRELSDAYQLLSEQTAKLFAAMESIEAALVVCDSRGVAAFVNPACARVLQGATPILGESVTSALAAGDLEAFAALFEHLDQIEISSEKTRVETRRGMETLAAQFTPLVSEDGLPLGAMLVVSNVSTQRELDRMKADFVGYVAHELRTPLTTILGYASLIDQAAGHFSIEQTREMTEIISRHCRRMNRLIGDLLDLSRLENGLPLPLQVSPFDAAQLCERVLQEQRLYLSNPEWIEVVFDCETRPLECFADPDRLEQIVINLLSNAIKYSPDGGKISLHLHREANGVGHISDLNRVDEPVMVLEMRDQGMGLNAEQISRLFQKFYRTSDARARGIKGTGLGLNLVREIVKTHGGTISASSPRDAGGKGATFRIVLPIGSPIMPATGRLNRASQLPARPKTG